MSPFSVEWTEDAVKDLKGLPAELQVRALRKVESARGDPLRHFERLKGERLSKLRVGDYRVLADVILSERRIVVHAIGHRKNVYRW